MDFDRLKEFTVIAKCGSINSAARELGVSCAVLSARLARFEKEMGRALFSRSRAGVAMTPAGQQLLPYALDILASFRHITHEVQVVQAHTYHGLRIAVSGPNLPLYLGPFLDRLIQAHPNMQLEILDDSTFGIEDGIRSGEVDLYFAPVMEHFRPAGLVRTTISSPGQYIILPRSHRFADRNMLSIRELDGEQFLLYPKTAEPAIRDYQIRNLEDSGIGYTLCDTGTAPLFYKLLVPIGKGLLLHPTPMMDLPPNTVCLPITDFSHPAISCFFYSKTNQNPDVLAFAKDFPAFAKELISHEHHQSA